MTIYAFEYSDPPDDTTCMIFGERGIRYPHKVSGTAEDDNGNPVKKKILAILRGSLIFLRATTSDASTGEWLMSGLPKTEEKSILILGVDDTGEYNTEAADFITAYGGLDAEEEE